MESTSHVYDMVYDQKLEELRFIVAGPTDTIGQAIVAVPDQYLSPPFEVRVDGTLVPSTRDVGSITFKYAHSGRRAVIISGE